MTGQEQPGPDRDGERSRLIRRLYDVAEVLSREPRSARAGDMPEMLSGLIAAVDALDDPEFARTFRSAVRHLLPKGPAGDGA